MTYSIVVILVTAGFVVGVAIGIILSYIMERL